MVKGKITASTGAKIPPQSLDAERSVLGSILIDKDAIVKVADQIDNDDFYDERHAQIYLAMKKLYDARSPIDVLTLSESLRNEGWLDTVGGASYLSDLTNYVPTAANVEHYAGLMVDKAMRRKIIESSKQLNELGYQEAEDLVALISEAERSIFAISEKQVKSTLASVESILGDSFERLDDLHKNKGKIRGVPTGLKNIDRILAGLQRSDLLVLAARPSMGKTALMLNLARNIATKAADQGAVLLFSLEMSKEQLVDRMLSAEAGVDAWNLRTGNLSDDDFERIGHAMGTLSEAPIFIDDSPVLTISDMRTKARRLMHQQPLSLVVVDYMQLMSGGARFAATSNRVQEISEISRGLKGIARELNVPLVALSQLSRSVESRPDKRPQLSDLRESGSIEQDADVVAFIYREEYYNPDTTDKNVTEILIRKHRNGPTGVARLMFDNAKQRFFDLAENTKDPF
jgi:replicative DNA helicase